MDNFDRHFRRIEKLQTGIFYMVGIFGALAGLAMVSCVGLIVAGIYWLLTN
jgi:hypothetical protein